MKTAAFTRLLGAFFFVVVVTHCRVRADEVAEACKQGDEAANKGDFDLAISCFTEAIRLDPQRAVAYNNRGIVYFRKRELAKAIADLTEAIRLNPQGTMYHARGLMYLMYGQDGDYDKAIADYTEAIRLDPQNGNAHTFRGIVHDKKGDYDEAIADYTKAIGIDPRNADAYYSRGVTYGRKGDDDKAIADYTEAIRLNPQYAIAYNKRGVAYGRKGEMVKAGIDFARATELGFKDTNDAVVNRTSVQEFDANTAEVEYVVLFAQMAFFIVPEPIDTPEKYAKRLRNKLGRLAFLLEQYPNMVHHEKQYLSNALRLTLRPTLPSYETAMEDMRTPESKAVLLRKCNRMRNLMKERGGFRSTPEFEIVSAMADGDGTSAPGLLAMPKLLEKYLMDSKFCEEFGVKCKVPK